MISGPPAASGASQVSRARPLWQESLLVLVAGLSLAFVANSLSPRGLSLTRNYFPSQALVSASTNAAAPATEPRVLASMNPVAARLRAKGLNAVDLQRVRALFADPRYLHGTVVFVDARDDFIYQVGHIPGAHQFNHYRPEERLADVVAACAPAERVVVYCTGGDCEDSEFAGIMLTQAGVAAERLLIYTGGMDEWISNRLPVEVGLRGSGVMKEPSK